MTFRLRSFSLYFLLLLIAVALGNIVVIWLAFAQVEDSGNRIARTHAVISSSQTLLNHLVDAETGQRGYLLTGDTAYLEPYVKGKIGARESLELLRIQVQNKPQQREWIQRVETSMGHKLSGMEDTISLFQNGYSTQAVDEMRRNFGKRYMDDIRRTLGLMLEEEQRLLEVRREEYRLDKMQAQYWYAGTTLLILVVAFAGFYVLRSKVIRPVDELSTQMKHFGQGAPLVLQERSLASAEVRELVEAFEHMAANLSSKQQALQEALALAAESNRALNVSNKELESFSYSVSHDLRAPLRAVDGFSKILLKDYGERLDKEGQELLGRMRAGAQRMGQLIDDMLVLSRISRAELKPQLFDLSHLVEQTVEQLRESFPERQVEVSIQPELQAKGDPGLIRIVLDNLLGNAWKFTGKTDQARVEFGCALRDGQPAYFIRDNGAGFDMAYGDKLFGAFQRLHSSADYPGSGIGLATVARIIHKHGGDVHAEGVVGQGAVFWFSLAS